MKIKCNYPALFIIISGMFCACQKTDLDKHRPIEHDNIDPGMVTNVKVINLPGAAEITYSLPADKDLQYVEAKYKINATTTRVAKSSRYGDTIHVDGFNDAGEYTVQLYAVDKSENKSDPVPVKVAPTTPTYRTIASTLQVRGGFGGITVTFDNPEESKIALVVLTNDNNDELVPAETFYTQIKKGAFSVRGYDTSTRTFGVYIKDRWNNCSDTLFKTVRPLFEKMLDKSKFRLYFLPDDQPYGWGLPLPNLWDGVLTEPGFSTTQGGLPHPQRFTFDMGVIAKLSRFKILQRMGSYLYNHGNPKDWIMYGTAATPDPDGSWNGWTELMECHSIKPSGLPPGQNSEEDLQYAKGSDGLGEEFIFPTDTPPVRYIRIKLLDNWSGTDFFNCVEITFWGSPE